MKKEEIHLVTPKYSFAPEADESLPPVKRTVNKVMEITEQFTVYDVFLHLARMDKAISDKEAEVEGLKAMRTNYLNEMVEIEKQLGIDALESQFAQLKADEVAAEEAAKANGGKKEDN